MNQRMNQFGWNDWIQWFGWMKMRKRNEAATLNFANCRHDFAKWSFAPFSFARILLCEKIFYQNEKFHMHQSIIDLIDWLIWSFSQWQIDPYWLISREIDWLINQWNHFTGYLLCKALWKAKILYQRVANCCMRRCIHWSINWLRLLFIAVIHWRIDRSIEQSWRRWWIIELPRSFPFDPSSINSRIRGRSQRFFHTDIQGETRTC